MDFDILLHNSEVLSAYDISTPLFIEDDNGNILSLEGHPHKSRDWSDTRTYSNIAICIAPLLRLKGLSDSEVTNYVSHCRQAQSGTTVTTLLTPYVNMKHCQTHNNIQSYFLYDAPEH